MEVSVKHALKAQWVIEEYSHGKKEADKHLKPFIKKIEMFCQVFGFACKFEAYERHEHDYDPHFKMYGSKVKLSIEGDPSAVLYSSRALYYFVNLNGFKEFEDKLYLIDDDE